MDNATGSELSFNGVSAVLLTNAAAQLSGQSATVAANAGNLLVAAAGYNTLRSNLGATPGDVANIVGSSVADGSVHATTKLLSIQTGIGGTPVEKAYFDKSGSLHFTGGANAQHIYGGGASITLDDSVGATIGYVSTYFNADSTTAHIIAQGNPICDFNAGAGVNPKLNLTYSIYLNAGNVQGLQWGASSSGMRLTTEVADGGSAVGLLVDTANAWTNAGAKLASFRNATVEKASISKDGLLSTAISTTTAQTFSGGKAGNVNALTSTAGSIAIDLAVDINFSHTLTENTTLAAPSNPVAGQSGAITFTQHASSPKTLAYNAFWKFPGGTIPTLTAVNSAVDVLTYYVISGSMAVCSLLKGVA
jgi:hypothetical protein